MTCPSPTPPRSSPTATSSTARCAGSSPSSARIVVLRYYLELTLPEAAEPSASRSGPPSPVSTGRSAPMRILRQAEDERALAAASEGGLRMTRQGASHDASTLRAVSCTEGLADLAEPRVPDYVDDILGRSPVRGSDQAGPSSKGGSP